jgi:histidinol dehydrogenase
MIPILKLTDASDRQRIEAILARLRLDPRDVALNRGDRAKAVATVTQILADVAQRGDAAIVDSSKQFDDPNFTAEQIRVSKSEMEQAASRTPADQMAALRRSIAQV